MPDRPGRTADTSHEVEDLEQLEADAAARNPDPLTRREALELELEEEDRSDEGSVIGDEIP